MDSIDGISASLATQISELKRQQLEAIQKTLPTNLALEQTDAKNKVSDSLNTVRTYPNVKKYIEHCAEKLQTSLKVLLLSGESQSGKTVFTQLLIKQLFEQQYIPIYIDLNKFTNLQLPFIENHLSESYKLSSDNIKELKNLSRVIFVFDHYGNNNLYNNLYSTQRLDEWGAKSIIVSDKKHLMKFKDYIPCFVPYHNNKRQIEFFKQSEISFFVMNKSNAQDNIAQQIDQSLYKKASLSNQKVPSVKQQPHNTTANIKTRIFDLLHHPLNERLFTNDLHVISLLSDKTKEDKNYVALLFDFIVYSKEDKSLGVAAANAITILAYANISLAGKNFANINIPYADLRNAVLNQSSFQNANLRYVKFHNAQMFQTDFSQASLDGAEFGQNPSISISGKISDFCYSYNGLLIAVHDHNTVSIFNALLWELERTFTPLKNITGVALSPLGDILVTFQHEHFSSSSTGVLSIWDVHNGTKLYYQEMQVLLGHEGIDITFLPTIEQQIFAIGFVKTVNLYEIDRKDQIFQIKLLHNLKLPIKTNRSCLISFDPTGEKLAVGVSDGGIIIFNIRSGKIIKTCPNTSIPI